MILLIMFWASLGVVAFAYVGYPLVIWLCSILFGGRSQASTSQSLPSITLLVAAHNEDSVIAERLENALAMDYPRDKLQIVVASDGSRDRTAEIARSFADRGVRLLDYQPNRGKAATLNAAIAETGGELLVLSDANTMLDSNAVRALARWFDDPGVTAVCGRLILIDPATGRNVDSLYWRYETFLKKCESRLGALLGANGAIYAIRRDRYVPIPSETIVDDFVIPLLAQQRHGGRLIYDCDAVAREETPATMHDEFRRRARIGAGGFQSIGLLWRMLSPRHGWLACSLFSHKLLRWLCPFLLIAMLASNVALAVWPGGEQLVVYRALLACQVAFYLTAWIGARLPGRGIGVRLVRLTTMFSSMNLALLVGFFRWATGRQRGAWQRTARS